MLSQNLGGGMIIRRKRTAEPQRLEAVVTSDDVSTQKPKGDAKGYPHWARPIAFNASFPRRTFLSDRVGVGGPCQAPWVVVGLGEVSVDRGLRDRNRETPPYGGGFAGFSGCSTSGLIWLRRGFKAGGL